MEQVLESVLTPAQIEVCSLYVARHTIADIAEMTDRSPRTVKELRRRARRAVERAGLTWPRRMANVAGSHTYAGLN